MSLYEVIPEDLRSAEKQEDFLEWLRILPAPLHTKKYLLLDWCEFTEVKMTRKLAEAVGLPVEI